MYKAKYALYIPVLLRIRQTGIYMCKILQKNGHSALIILQSGSEGYDQGDSPLLLFQNYTMARPCTDQYFFRGPGKEHFRGEIGCPFQCYFLKKLQYD